MSVSAVDPQAAPPPLQFAEAEPLSDNLSRWASRLVGYASLAAACVGLLRLMF